MSTYLKTPTYCPNCGYRLEIKEDDQFVVIVDNGHAVTSCPNCMIPLNVRDGELVQDDDGLE